MAVVSRLEGDPVEEEREEKDRTMPWQNNPLALYHGCDDDSANNIRTPGSGYSHGIQLAYGRPLLDFGRGFYTTTNLLQAKHWANSRIRRLRRVDPNQYAVVLRFEVDRNLLAMLQTLCFVTEGMTPPQTDYWELVRHCRLGLGNHRPTGGGNYDVVYGPVSLWPQTLVIKDCDQISFHTHAAMTALPTPSYELQASSSDPYLT